ncbi:MAG: molybdopterin molybdotransferase MoeA [Verrucomicrobia bacterium]|nr:molybdopterin molybdotransferase MoeA [Verrucomicrobiota bacterium]
MLTVEQARQTILDAVAALPADTVPTAAALGCVLSEDVTSDINIPSFDNSAMDGYAVRASDVAGACAERPLRLRCQGEVPAGSVASSPLQVGCALKIFTGAPVPPGADAVVIQEDTRREGDVVVVLDSEKTGANIRRAGEDIGKGVVVLRRGSLCGASHVGVAASLGRAQLSVVRRPRVAVLATGEELVTPGKPLGPGQIYESNSPTLAALVRQAGCESVTSGIVPDTLEATQIALTNALVRADAVITSGGVSVGEYDFVKDGLAALGADTKLWKVAMKPGKPLVFSMCNGKPVFGLPGNPVSAFITFLLFVWPALQKMRGLASDALDLPTANAVAEEPFGNKGDRRHFLRVGLRREGDRLLARAAGGRQQSHILSGLLDTDGLIGLDPGASVPAGSAVRVILLPTLTPWR